MRRNEKSLMSTADIELVRLAQVVKRWSGEAAQYAYAGTGRVSTGTTAKLKFLKSWRANKFH
jgi:hypothetical protein